MAWVLMCVEQRYDQSTTAIEQLLKALWHSEFLTRLTDYRTGIILLADISLEFGMSKRSQRILDEIMPQARKPPGFTCKTGI